MRVLYIDQTAELGGAELWLLGEVTNLPYEASVLLFQDGRFREMLAQAGISVEVLLPSAAARGVKKGSGLWSALAAVPSVWGPVLAVAARARRHDVVYANSQKALVVGAFRAREIAQDYSWQSMGEKYLALYDRLS